MGGGLGRDSGLGTVIMVGGEDGPSNASGCCTQG